MTEPEGYSGGKLDYTRPQNHALPMRMMLEELRCVRGEQDFLQAIVYSTWTTTETSPVAPFSADTTLTILARLESALATQEAAYKDLEDRKEHIRSEVRAKLSEPTHFIDLEQRCYEADKPLKRMIYHLRGNALAFSGGGIRSASFCLGVLQGLARFSFSGGDGKQKSATPETSGLLFDTQFLSTVSGGGYLGCWLSSWIARQASAQAAEGATPTGQHFRNAYKTALRGLAGLVPETGADPSPEPIRHLREFTSYLAPQLGFSLDTWALAAIILRNMLVNFLMLAPLLLFLVTLPLLPILGLRNVQHLVDGQSTFFFVILFVLVALSSIFSGRALPSYLPWANAPRTTAKDTVAAGGVLVRFILPVLAVCFLLSAHFYPGTLPTVPSALDGAGLAAVATVGFGILSVFKWWTHYATYPGGEITDRVPMPASWAAALMFAVTIALGSGTGVALELIGTRILPFIARLHVKDLGFVVTPENYIIFSVPAFLTVLLLGSTLFSALTQLLESEEDREWWSRSGGFLMMSGFAWIAATAIYLYGTVHLTNPTLRSELLPSASGGVLGLITSFIAKSAKTSAGARPESSAVKKSPLHSMLLPALAILSLTLLAIGLARVSEALRGRLPFHSLAIHPTLAAMVLLALFALLASAVNLLVNINIFSMHGLYRERLMRAFLGASNPQRHTDAFTDFDSGDTLLMHQLARSPGVPLHIVNTTLNLVGTRRAAWRQRKAEAFSFSSISAGAWRLNYVAADKFGGDEGVSVATAMAISGAAANPNMGYHSSPLLTILMTLFNVRLGWWLPNPKYPLDQNYATAKREQFWHRSGPLFSVWPLLQELFGLTDDTRGYVELSDGGHFEDLGIYEMVMRRCRNIIVIDAGSDPTYTFEDLGNALRKIQIDLGIPIEFPVKPTMQAGRRSMPSAKNRYCAVANIRYSCVDDTIFTDGPANETLLRQYQRPAADTSTMDGKLIYIKACLNGTDEPMDVTEYALSHATFPHESTGNQFFNEAQFESYRSLGSHVASTIGATPGGNGTDWDHWIAAATTYAK